MKDSKKLIDMIKEQNSRRTKNITVLRILTALKISKNEHKKYFISEILYILLISGVIYKITCYLFSLESFFSTYHLFLLFVIDFTLLFSRVTFYSLAFRFNKKYKERFESGYYYKLLNLDRKTIDF